MRPHTIGEVVRGESRVRISVVLQVQVSDPRRHLLEATLVGNFFLCSAQLILPAVLLFVVPVEPGDLDPHQTEVDPVHGTQVFLHVVDEDVEVMVRRHEVSRRLQQDQNLVVGHGQHWILPKSCRSQ